VTEVELYASLSLFASGSGVADRRGQNARDGCPGNADQRSAARHTETGPSNRRNSNGGHGRNDCRSQPEIGSADKNIDGHSPAIALVPPVRPVLPHALVDERRQSVNNAPTLVPRTV
jgi:hypothetical protein